MGWFGFEKFLRIYMQHGTKKLGENLSPMTI
jgi:hypothetical protein